MSYRKTLNRCRAAFFVLAVTLLLATGCERPAETTSAPTPAAPTSAPVALEPVPTTLMLEKAPENPQDVAALKASAKEGDEVVLRGIIGGEEQPFAWDTATFYVIDPAVVTCDKMPGHSCPTPWDACCAKDRVAKRATIQVLNAAGQPLKAGLQNTGGLAPAKEVIVVGKVRGTIDEKTFTIDATGIYVKG